MGRRTAVLALALLLVPAFVAGWSGRTRPPLHGAPPPAPPGTDPSVAVGATPAGPRALALPASSPAATSRSPKHVGFVHGQVVNVAYGVYYFDPHTGEVEGWESPDALTSPS